MKLKRVVGGQANIESNRVILGERILDIVQEHGVIAEWRHGNAHLTQVEEVHEHGHLAQHQAMRDVVGEHERANKVIHGARLARVRPKIENVHVALATQVVQREQVGVRVVEVVDVGRILVGGPVLGQRGLHVEHVALGLGLVVHRVEARHVVQELVQVGMRARVHGHLEQGHEDVVQDLAEVLYQLVRFEYVTLEKGKKKLVLKLKYLRYAKTVLLTIISVFE